MKIDKFTILNRVEKVFIKEDKEEPFLDREYAEETKRLFKMLKEHLGDFEDYRNRAIYDIVEDIFRER